MEEKIRVETVNETRNKAKIVYLNELYTFIIFLLIMKYLAINTIGFWAYTMYRIYSIINLFCAKHLL